MGNALISPKECNNIPGINAKYSNNFYNPYNIIKMTVMQN